MRQSAKTKLVYVTGLHAVQFGNNWIQKIPLTAKLDWTVKLGNFDRPHNFFHPFFFSKLDRKFSWDTILRGCTSQTQDGQWHVATELQGLDSKPKQDSWCE